MKIRPATYNDLAEILEIYNDAVLTTTAACDYEPRPLEHRIAWFEDHSKLNYPVFVAENEAGRIVGWSSLNRYHDRMGYRFATENSVYVATDQRGKGNGEAAAGTAHRRGTGARFARYSRGHRRRK